MKKFPNLFQMKINSWMSYLFWECRAILAPLVLCVLLYHMNFGRMFVPGTTDFSTIPIGTFLNETQSCFSVALLK